MNKVSAYFLSFLLCFFVSPPLLSIRCCQTPNIAPHLTSNLSNPPQQQQCRSLSPSLPSFFLSPLPVSPGFSPATLPVAASSPLAPAAHRTVPATSVMVLASWSGRITTVLRLGRGSSAARMDVRPLLPRNPALEAN